MLTANKKERLITVLLIGIALCYAIVLLRLVLFKTGLSFDLRQLQLIPFLFIRDIVVADAAPDILFINDMGNVAIFIPLGILLPLFFSGLSIKKTILYTFLVSLGFEIVQFITGLGMSDVDDLILNTLGGAIGAGLYYGVFYRRRQPLQAAVWSLLFLIIFGCCGAVFLWQYSPGSLPSQIVYQNQEVLAGIDRESYDFTAVCLSAEDGSIRVKSASSGEGNDSADENQISSYPLAENVLCILEYRSYQYSSNGNIQKTTVTYKAVDIKELSDAIEQGTGYFCDLWYNENQEIAVVVITIFEKS